MNTNDQHQVNKVSGILDSSHSDSSSESSEDEVSVFMEQQVDQQKRLKSFAIESAMKIGCEGFKPHQH